MNYKESSISGTTYTRAKTVIIHNPLSELANIQFHSKKQIFFAEETIANINGKAIPISESSCYMDFNMGSIIPIIDPNTNEVTGSITHEELYVILYSLYIQTALQRDTKVESDTQKYIQDQAMQV